METHAHHLHKAPGKNFWHYFFEFFMLFLAVSLGFFVENLREHHVENEREEQYMKSLVNDLKTDVTTIDTITNYNLQSKIFSDSLVILLTLPDFSDKTASIYYCGRKASLRYFLSLTDGTMKQLSNAGGLRLIHHQDIVDSINAYYSLYSGMDRLQQLKELQLRDYRDACCKIFDVRVFETMFDGINMTRPEGQPKLLSTNSEDINVLDRKSVV